MPVWLWSLIKVVLLLVWCLLNAAWLVLMERKVAAYMQNRLGPNRAGPWGILQTVADVAKLIQKEDIIPRNVDKWLFQLAPILAFIPALLVWLIVPFGPGATAMNLNIGIIFVAAITGYAVISIFMAGWGSNNKYALMGAMRGAAQMISYEVTLVMSIIGVVMMAGSLQLSEIVDAQAKHGFLSWYIWPQILGLIVYIIASLAELNRAPFDLTEAESELVAGYHTEYSGMRFGTFFLAEYVNLLAWSAIAASCFLGGWRGPTPPDIFYGLANIFQVLHATPLADALTSFAESIGWLNAGAWAFIWGFLWLVIKTYIFVFFAMWVRWTLPRVRIDQLMDLGWKFLLPVSMFNLFLTAVMKYLALNVFTNTWLLSWWR